MAEDQKRFRDHFSGAAPQYAAFRPLYPLSLFQALAEGVPLRRRAWDCATGNGQAAVGLARHFDHVIATDASAEQLALALFHARVTYARACAERSPLRGHCVDLVTVAQALHWFDRPAFFAEARRVLSPGGLLAVWSYGLPEIEPALDRLLGAFYHDVVGPYWPAERRMVENGYRSIQFPFEEVLIVSPPMEAVWSLEDLSGYLGTWSATLRYRAALGRDPIPELLDAMRPAWGQDDRRRAVRWPLSVRAGRTRA